MSVARLRYPAPALYPLKQFIAGFDFFPWMIMQKMGGAQSVVFDTAYANTVKWPLHIVMQRYESILKPGPALLGMPSHEGSQGQQYGPYHQSDLVRMAHGKVIPRLKSVLRPYSSLFTVTLRNTQRAPARNSNDEAWRTFAAEIGATVIEDYEDKPMHLHERMALYAGAKMNFFVTNGPAMLCFLSEYPAMQFSCQQSSPVRIGVREGGRYPWLLPQHHMVWEPDTLENIRKHFELWLGGQK